MTASWSSSVFGRECWEQLKNNLLCKNTIENLLWLNAFLRQTVAYTLVLSLYAAASAMSRNWWGSDWNLVDYRCSWIDVFSLCISDFIWSWKALLAFSAPEICRIQQKCVQVAGSSSQWNLQTRGKGPKEPKQACQNILSWVGLHQLLDAPGSAQPNSCHEFQSKRQNMNKHGKSPKHRENKNSTASPKTRCTVAKGCTVLRYLSTLSGPSPRSSMVDASPPTASAHA